MKQFTSKQLREMWLDFYRQHGHAIIPSASIIPENDPTVLFTTAGMHPLVPYLMGQHHPEGKRLANVQKCIRTGDIDDVGDDSHLTFFEMLGNWSLGDYFKEKKIPWSWEFLTSPDYLGLDPDRLAFSVFEGDEDAPRDMESHDLWIKCGARKDQIYFLPKEYNWWGPAGQTGPCGPDTEMFLITDKEPCSPECSPACSCGRYLEICNDVFMQYNKKEDGTFEPLSQKNVDTGMGLERALCALIGAPSVYETEIFAPIIQHIEELSGKSYKEAPEEELRAFRIVSDHLRTAVFILGDPRGVTPSNVDQGYVLRRLIRRAVRFGMNLGLQEGFTSQIAQTIIDKYKEPYPELEQNRALALEQLLLEEQRFQRTLQQGTRMFEKLMQQLNRSKNAVNQFLAVLSKAQSKDERTKAADALLKVLRPTPEMKPLMEALKEAKKSDDYNRAQKAADEFLQSLTTLNGRDAFKLYDTYGFPFEMTLEMAKEQGLTVDKEDFDRRFKKHQETSQAGAQQRFKGGLADGGVQTTRLHTATHLLHAALRKVLGEDVHQRGSNITAERLRFDFSFGRKMTKEELNEVEDLVNQAIKANAPISYEEMTVAEAEAQNAIGLFESKYGEKVKVYTMGDFSKEICGGPHAENTGELVSFKIRKEESSSAGVRRIRATIGAQQ